MVQYRGDRVAAGKKISASLQASHKIKEAAILNAQRAANRLSEYLKQNKPHLKQIGVYISAKDKIEFHCSIHNINFLEVPNYLRNGSYGCPECTTDGRKKNNAAKRPEVIAKTLKARSLQTPEEKEDRLKRQSASKIRATVKHLDEEKQKQYFNRGWMYDFHVNQQKNLIEIGEYFGVLNGVIADQLGRLEIEVVTQKVSQAERGLAAYIASLGIAIECNNRQLIRPKEIDIFIPSHKLAIEYHGCYWHSNKYHPKNYHLDKLKSCQNMGINLIQIWEDDWKEKEDVCKKFILNKLGMNPNRINARDCKIQSLDQQSYYQFLEANHMQGGHATASIRLGLFSNSELVAVMGFKKVPVNVSKYDNKEGYELCRFASLGVRGGFSKLLNHFRKNNKHDYIISFGDLEIVDRYNNVYLKNGFVEHSVLEPDYTYFVTKKRQHKFNFRKSGFEKYGFDIEGKTETQLAEEAGLKKCWNSGKVCYILHSERTNEPFRPSLHSTSS